MIYLTGDTHGCFTRIGEFVRKMNTTADDIMIILGDAGVNYFGNPKDMSVKAVLSEYSITLFCLHGNHEMRPAAVGTYKMKEFCGGFVWYEENYPNILFAKDGEIYTLGGKRCIAIGGAYSVDKQYRLNRGYGWWADEQPSEEIKAYVEEQLKNNAVDVILSHTCPYKYEPRETFLPFISQDTIDCSTEKWLDVIEESTNYKAWYCGHWHTDKRIDKMHFLFESFEML